MSALDDLPVIRRPGCGLPRAQRAAQRAIALAESLEQAAKAA